MGTGPRAAPAETTNSNNGTSARGAPKARFMMTPLPRSGERVSQTYNFLLFRTRDKICSEPSGRSAASSATRHGRVNGLLIAHRFGGLNGFVDHAVATHDLAEPAITV